MPNILNLSNVTLVGIDGVGDDTRLIKALKYSSKDITFGDIKVFSCSNHDITIGKTIKIDKMSWDECQYFTLNNIVDYIDTEYIIIVQNDGFIVNKNHWSFKFFNYDYIGAPWSSNMLYINTQRWSLAHQRLKESMCKYTVGNGGFSMRSKKLLNVVKNMYNKEYENIPEDVVISICMRKQLETFGCKFPDTITAANFSCESTLVDDLMLSSDDSFGFHCDETHPNKVKLLENI
jgi:hypothetical protein